MKIDEVLHIHPIFRANPHWLVPGAVLERGEAPVLDAASGKRIDLVLRASDGTPCYAEIKWSSIDREQIREYSRLLRQRHPDGAFRLIWVVPADLRGRVQAEDLLLVEVVEYDRAVAEALANARDRCRGVLAQVVNALQDQVEITIYRERLPFNSIIHACYFDAQVRTERGVREVGLRKQSAGRYLDLILRVCSAVWASLLPEAALSLVRDLLSAPYFFDTRLGGTVELRGFRQHVENNMHATFWKPIGAVVRCLSALVDEHHAAEWPAIRHLYRNPEDELDILWRLLRDYFGGDAARSPASARDMVSLFVGELGLCATAPTRTVHHVGLGQAIANKVTAEGYENDMAKRLVELAALKRMLIPRAGVPQVWLLTPVMHRGAWTVKRSQCQSLQFNPDRSTHLSLDMWRAEP